MKFGGKLKFVKHPANVTDGKTIATAVLYLSHLIVDAVQVTTLVYRMKTVVRKGAKKKCVSTRCNLVWIYFFNNTCEECPAFIYRGSMINLLACVIACKRECGLNTVC